MIGNPREPRAGPRYGPVSWSGNPTRPFCSLASKLISLASKLIDLGGWLDEAYRVPGAPLPLEPAPAPDATRAGG